MEFSFTVYNRHASAQTNDLITVGLPFVRGAAPSADCLRIVDSHGQPVAAQYRVLGSWPAGGVRWVLARFAASLPAHSSAVYQVEVTEQPAGTRNAPVAGLLQRTSETGVSVDTGRLQVEFTGDPAQWIRRVSVPERKGGGLAAWDPTASGGQLYAMLKDGALTPRFDGPPKFLDNGPLVGEMLYNGRFIDAAGTDVLRFLLRVIVQKDSNLLRLSYTLHNPRHQPREELGHFRLGLPNGALIRQAGLRFSLPKEGIPYAYLAGESGQVAGESGQADHFAPLLRSAWLQQDSSGGVNWHHRNHVDRDFKVTTQFRGYRMVVDGQTTYSGNRAIGWAAVGNQRLGIAFGVEKLWQNFPKAVGAYIQPQASDGKGAVLECGLFPDCGAGYEHELQGGEQKTHHLLLSFHRTDMYLAGQQHSIAIPNVVYPGLKTQMERVLTQDLTLPSAAQVLASEFMQPTVAYDPKRFPEYEALVACNLDDPAFDLYKLREKWDEYGWRSFGDINADCEVNGLIHSHYNNEYDLSRGMLFQALRRSGLEPEGCRKWADLGLDAARHQADIDIYHTSEDPMAEGAYNGGKFTHTAHALEVGRATHRQADCFALWGELDWPWGRGGAPESGHFDNEGTILAYYLTGDPVLRNASLEIAECVVYKVSNNRFPQHYYDRSSGNNLACCLDAWRNTWDDRYLAAIETILDKTRLSAAHGPIPIDAEGLAPIGGWSASIFLKSTLRFLYEYRQVSGEVHKKAWEIVREYADCWHKYGWDEKSGRFHPVVPHESSRDVSGAGSDYVDANWFTIDALGFAAMFREDKTLQKRDIERCVRAYKSYCAVRAPGYRPIYVSTKVTTFTINNGHSVLYAMDELDLVKKGLVKSGTKVSRRGKAAAKTPVKKPRR